MSGYTDDIHAHKARQHYFSETDQAIRIANQEVIHGRIPQLDQERAFAFAVCVARLRAEYLEAALAVCGKDDGPLPDAEQMAGLRQKRELYEEARAAYDALRRAMEVGYIDIGRMIVTDEKT